MDKGFKVVNNVVWMSLVIVFKEDGKYVERYVVIPPVVDPFAVVISLVVKESEVEGFWVEGLIFESFKVVNVVDFTRFLVEIFKVVCKLDWDVAYFEEEW